MMTDKNQTDILSEWVDWIDAQDIMQKLHISPRTLQTWRTNNILPFSRIQGKLYYRKSDILAEYLGYLFIKPSVLKLEKALLLYGKGANGKSVFFEIVNSLLGNNNVSSYSLQNLTNENGYYRAMLANKLLNYASEINGKLEASIFKQLVSGEPVEARLPYGDIYTHKLCEIDIQLQRTSQGGGADDCLFP